MTNRVATIILPALLCAATARAQQRVGETRQQVLPNSVAILDTVPYGIDNLAGSESATSAMLAFAATGLNLTVVPSEVKHRIPAEQVRMLSECDADPCVVASDFGLLTGAARIVVSSLATKDGKQRLTVTAFDTRTGKRIGRAGRELYSTDDLTESAKDLVFMANRNAPRGSRGYIRVLAAKTGAMVSIDGMRVEDAMLSRMLPEPPGTHQIHVEKDGESVYDTQVAVTAGNVTPVLLPGIAAASAEMSAIARRPMPASNSFLSTGQTVAIAIGAVGVAALGVGTGLGVANKQAFTYIKGHIQPGATVATQIMTANGEGTGANILWGVGGGLVAAGGAFFIAGEF